MKRNIFLLYFSSISLVFISILAWEFLLEPNINSLFYNTHGHESIAEQWEYVKTVFLFCAVTLIIPTLLALKIEKKRQATLNSLHKLQNETANFLNERTIELASVRQELDTEKFKQSSTIGRNDTTNISMQSLIDSISDSIMVIDTNYQVRMLNKAAREIHLNGSQLSETILCHKLSHHEDTPCKEPEHQCPFSIVMETGKSCTVLHHHFDSHGVNAPFEIQASPIHNENGDVIGIIELARDVSDRLAREQKQKDADTRLLNLQKDQSIATLAGGLSHEFNNILTSILGNAELLSVRLDERDINRKQADAIIQGSEHLADLTRQLLAYAKGGKYLDQSLNINAQINDALSLIYTDKFSGIEVELDIAEDLWPILGDPGQISQLIMNIIINGFEALENTAGKLIIRTANLTKAEKWKCKENLNYPAGDYVFFSVTNTGAIISEEILAKVFEPFFSTKFAGRGMGLAATKGIVQNHNGCISVQNGSDETTFQVFLPREITDKETIMGDGDSSGDISGLKVLVVDDEPQVLSIIKSLLDHHGCNVLSADKGQEALEIIERHKADLDLVILDIQMPDMTGDKVYIRLKEIKPGLNVLISSGLEEYTALKNILLDPKDKFIKKPFRMSDLMLKIKELTVNN